jgi:tRNA pseudouridine38-40 synthase
MRRLLAVRVARAAQADGVLWRIDFTANAFLQHMVRNLVGALVEIGRGDLSPAAAGEMLASRDRTKAAVAAPPTGLTLVEVLYPEHYGLPAMTDAD